MAESYKIRGFSGKWDIVGRVFSVIYPLLMAILFSISLGFNNSSGANDLPKSIENCTIDLDSLDVVSVRRSINIVDSVFLTLCVVAVVYTLFICLMKTINPEILEEKWKIFNTMDIVFFQVYTHVAAALICAINVLIYLYRPYYDAVQASLSGDAQIAARAINGVNWAIFGISFGFYFFYFSYHNNLYGCSYHRYYSQKCQGNSDSTVLKKDDTF